MGRRDEKTELTAPVERLVQPIQVRRVAEPVAAAEGPPAEAPPPAEDEHDGWQPVRLRRSSAPPRR